MYATAPSEPVTSQRVCRVVGLLSTKSSVTRGRSRSGSWLFQPSIQLWYQATAKSLSRSPVSATGTSLEIGLVIAPPYSERFSDVRPNRVQKSNTRPIRSASADTVTYRGLVEPDRRGD